MSWLKKDIDVALQKFPKLKLFKKEGVIKGDVDLINPESKNVIETYNLEVSIPVDYLKSKLPRVKELSKKIPRKADRHVDFEGVFCLSTPLKEFLICRNGITMISFFDTILLPFLASQFAISAGWIDEFPQGEYGHDGQGIYETYAEFFECSDHEILINGLKMALAKNQRNKSCFCESGNKLKNCHSHKIELLKNMGKVQLAKDLNILKVTLDQLF